jgi:putative sterol carrier protein
MARARALTADLPEVPGASVRVQQVVTAAPGGDVRYVTVIEDGRTVEQRLGDEPDADVTLTAVYDDAVLIHRGELDMNAAFMQGRLKVAGDMAKLLRLLPLAGRPESRDAVRRLAEETAFP